MIIVVRSCKSHEKKSWEHDKILIFLKIQEPCFYVHGYVVEKVYNSYIYLLGKYIQYQLKEILQVFIGRMSNIWSPFFFGLFGFLTMLSGTMDLYSCV